jgi:hypothetical protein
MEKKFWEIMYPMPEAVGQARSPVSTGYTNSSRYCDAINEQLIVPRPNGYWSMSYKLGHGLIHKELDGGNVSVGKDKCITDTVRQS